MEKIFSKKGICGLIMSAVLITAGVLGGSYLYKKNHLAFPEQSGVTDFCTNLDHDIYVSGASKIVDTQYTGFDTWVGPTGWPWTDKVMWEVALFETSDSYYARLIFHEYMLWWSWDDPYIVCKIPKENVDGDLRTNEKLRNQVLWDITNTTLKSYNYKPYMPDAKIEKINGHSVTFGNYRCTYNKYFVISDKNHSW